MSDSRAIYLSTEAVTGITSVIRISGANAEDLGFDLREVGFRAAKTGEPAGIMLDADCEATNAAVAQLRAWGYDVVMDGF